MASSDQAERLLEAFRSADHVALLALPDLSAVAVQCQTGEDAAVACGFYFSRYGGDWNKLLSALFSPDIKKVSHDVKDLTRTLLENGLPAEGFVFDTALAGYLLDASRRSAWSSPSACSTWTAKDAASGFSAFGPSWAVRPIFSISLLNSRRRNT